MTTRRRSDDGFTMIELLVSLTIVVIGLIGLFSTMLSASRGNAIGEAIVQATMLAEERLERLRTLDTVTLQSLPAAEATPAPVTVKPVLTAGEQAKATGVVYTINASSVTPAGSTGVLQLTVRVAWKMPEEAAAAPGREVAVSTMVFRPTN